MKRRLLILLFWFSTGYCAYSQSSLGIDSINYSAPAFASYNSQYLFVVNIVNYGPQPYNYQVDVQYAIDSTGTGVNMIDTTNSHIVGCTLGVGASKPDSSIITIGNSFRNGINTVVIWPRTMDGVSTTHDSLKLNFMVVVNAIENYTETRPLIFPNPTKEKIQVLSTDPKFIIERVRILSVDGLLIETPRFKGELNVGQLNPGIYFVELISTTGTVARYKVVKE